MPLNKSNSIDVGSHPVDNIIDFQANTGEKKKAKPETKLKNFRIEKELIRQVELFCQMQNVDCTQIVTKFFRGLVDDNIEMIKKYEKAVKM
ncbi:MAG: hypothetical protein FWC80_03330 [Firmicutes bacterium]|nr:hypothetical protein [Bacillota bacterium]